MVAKQRRHIGGYRIIAPIGVGSSSTVYRGLDEQSGQQVAIKVLADNHSLLPEMRERFLDEVELLAAVDSSSIAAIYEIGETEAGQPFMVLELADRGDLRHRLDELRMEDRAVTVPDLLALGRHLTDSLSALHGAGIVHRDVSPGNVLIQGGVNHPSANVDTSAILEPDERFLLTDLGLAKDLHYASGLTAGGGTRGFAAPEQQDEVTVIDARADIFSATALMEWAALTVGLTTELDPFFDIGLAPEPEDRFATMEQWFEALHRCLEPNQLTPERALPRSPGAAKSRFTFRPPRVAVVAVGALLCVAVAGAGLLFAIQDNQSDIETTGSEQTEEASDQESQDQQGQRSTDDDLDPLVVDGSTIADNSPAPDETQLSEGSSETTIDGTTSTAESASTTEVAPTLSPAESASTAAPTTSNDSSATSGPTTTLTTRVTATTAVPTAPSTTATTTLVTRSTLAPTSTLRKELTAARAYIQSPLDGATESGAVTIRGTAGSPQQGIERVRLVIKNLDSGLYWNRETNSLEFEFFVNYLSVLPALGNDVRWSISIAAGKLSPGTYRLRVWAEGTEGNDPRSNETRLVIE